MFSNHFTAITIKNNIYKTIFINYIFLIFVVFYCSTSYAQIEKYVKTGGSNSNNGSSGLNKTSGSNKVPATEYSYNVPIHTNREYSASQTIYKYSEIGTFGTITKIGWRNNSGEYPVGPNDVFKVYLKKTTETTPGSNVDLSTYTLVYSANPNFLVHGTFGWRIINLSTPFEFVSTSSINLSVVTVLSRETSYDYPKQASYYWNDDFGTTTNSPTATYEHNSVPFSSSSTLTKRRYVPRAYFYFSNNSALPISLISFNAIPRSKKVELNWSTASESNNNFYTIFRSSDLLNWEIIGKIDGNGTTNFQIDYSFFDFRPLNGISYYQLKQTDFNGEFELFDPVSVEFLGEEDNLISVFPNPCREGFKISINSKNRNRAFLSVSTLSGKIVYSNSIQLENGYNEFSINNPGFFKGLYFISVIYENGDKKLEKLIIE